MRLPETLVETMSLGVYEAVANAVEHAYHGREPGTVALRASLAEVPDTVVVTVSDEGRWRASESEPGVRGRGIPLMHALSSDVTISPGPGGTTVRTTWCPAEYSDDSEGT